MKKVLGKIGNGLLFGIGFLVVLFGGYYVVSWTSVDNSGADNNIKAENGDTLSLNKWNALVQKVSSIVTDTNGNVSVNGNLTASTFVGDGSGLTNLNIAAETDPNVNSLGKANLNCTTNQIAKYNGNNWVCANDNEGTTVSIPSGAIMAFNLTSCPIGWKIADGTNGTPDLRNRFIRGLGGSRTLGSFQSNANKSHTHIVNPAPVTSSSAGGHNHVVDPAPVSTTLNGSHTHNIRFYKTNSTTYNNGNLIKSASHYGSLRSNYMNGVEAAGNHRHTVNIPPTTSSRVGNHTHTIDIPTTTSTASGDTESRPDNIALLYCQKE